MNNQVKCSKCIWLAGCKDASTEEAQYCDYFDDGQNDFEKEHCRDCDFGYLEDSTYGDENLNDKSLLQEYLEIENDEELDNLIEEPIWYLGKAIYLGHKYSFSAYLDEDYNTYNIKVMA